MTRADGGEALLGPVDPIGADRTGKICVGRDQQDQTAVGTGGAQAGADLEAIGRAKVPVDDAPAGGQAVCEADRIGRTRRIGDEKRRRQTPPVARKRRPCQTCGREELAASLGLRLKRTHG
jgi:hypothetical protein